MVYVEVSLCQRVRALYFKCILKALKRGKPLKLDQTDKFKRYYWNNVDHEVCDAVAALCTSQFMKCEKYFLGSKATQTDRLPHRLTRLSEFY